MSYDADILKIKKMLERIVDSGAVYAEHNRKPKEKWISGSWLTKITGWGHAEKRQARKDNLVTWRKTEDGKIEYLLSSIPNEFKKSV